MKIHHWSEKKRDQRKMSVVTCSDYSFARILNSSSVDAILVGDSLAMTMHGHPNTLAATTDLMALHTRAVARGAPDKFLIGDLPFLSFRGDLNSSVRSVAKIMRAGAQSVKLEGCDGNIPLIKHLVESGVPVMGHLGLTPQSIHGLGGYRVQGREEDAQKKLVSDAVALEQAGCFSLVLECIPTSLARAITQKLKIPTIGIGAGSATDGQVLVLQDLLGMNLDFSPKFVRKYIDGAQVFKNALNKFHDDVTDGSFPGDQESYI